MKYKLAKSIHYGNIYNFVNQITLKEIEYLLEKYKDYEVLVNILVHCQYFKKNLHNLENGLPLEIIIKGALNDNGYCYFRSLLNIIKFEYDDLVEDYKNSPEYYMDLREFFIMCKKYGLEISFIN